jgi:2,3,4,5-tetrahydropyridine-2-carboxylate N-succinyltransferase
MFIQRQGHHYRDAATGQTLDMWYLESNGEPVRGSLAERLGVIVGDVIDTCIVSIVQHAASVEDIFLRLHLLSQRIVKPNDLDLTGIFGLLHNVAWTSAALCFPERLSNYDSWSLESFITLRSLRSKNSPA